MKILYSPGYGAGWLTWSRSQGNKEKDLFMLTYKPFIDYIEKNDSMPSEGDKEWTVLVEKFKEDWKSKFDSDDDFPYFGGVDGLQIKDVPAGCKFRIEEYDGFESVNFYSDADYFVADQDD
jgi:hypothetical protein